MIHIDDLLGRLDKVRKGKPGQWIACCPSHKDRSPSLSVRQTPDGRILLHCFAGCYISDVCDAIGLSVADLYPNTDTPTYAALPTWKRQRFEDALLKNKIYLEIAKADQAAGKVINDDEAQKIVQAVENIRKIQGVLNG